ncbi:MAG: minor capsid protein [Gemmiger sp.]
MGKNTSLVIHTPRGTLSQVAGRGGGATVEIRWESGFGPDWTARLQGAQAAFDAEVLRVTEPYVPYDTHLLARSADLASDVGGGTLEWATPYAAAQYYDTSDSRGYDPLAGAHWGERMKADRLPELERFAKGEVKT